jgi:mRNA interferase MazF
MPRRYVPDRGDIVWLQFDPQTGHEQSGRRPAIVVSPRSYNQKVGLALFCPITSRIKGYPFEVTIPSGKDISGVILSDQIKSLDWRARRAKRISRVPKDIMREVIAKIYALIVDEHLLLAR